MFKSKEREREYRRERRKKCGDKINTTKRRWRRKNIKRERENHRRYMLLYKKTKNGVVAMMHYGQRNSARKRNHPLPTYTARELREWCFKQPLFHRLYNLWVKSGYKRNDKPTGDRIRNDKSYTFSNLQLLTFRENISKAIPWNKGLIGLKYKPYKTRVIRLKEVSNVA